MYIKASPKLKILSNLQNNFPFPNHISFDQYLHVTGYIRPNEGYLTIGIPSIKRIVGTEYILRTLDSLISQLYPKFSNEVVIIVFLCDVLSSYNSQIDSELNEKYNKHLKSGFIRILRIDQEAYPPLEGLKRNFNDAPSRVSWRSKQVVDFAIMFSYSYNISNYYLQIEDDVECSKNFYLALKNYVNVQNQAGVWTMLEFSELGFIGKLFKSSVLDLLSNYLLMFYAEQPVDWLMTFFRLSMAQDKVLLRKPTLFQHFGIKSSFDYLKDNLLKDKFFESEEKPWLPDNPQAKIYTNMIAFESNTVDLAYDSGSGFFWTNTVTKGKEIFVIFENIQIITKIAIETGNKKNPGDILKKGSLLVGKQSSGVKNNVKCLNTTLLTSFKDGKAIFIFENNNSIIQNVSKQNISPDQYVKCLIITVNESQDNWLIVNQIAVFIKS